MGIVSSVGAQDNHTQADGTRYVQEFHTDSAGKIHRFEYRWSEGMDRDAIMTGHAARLAEDLAQGEVERAVEVDAAPQIVQQTGAQFLARLREIYRNSSKERCARIARWIVRRLDAGHVTEAQLRNVFNLSVGEWTTLESKLRSLASTLDALESAQGE